MFLVEACAGKAYGAEKQPYNFLKNHLNFWMNADNKFRQSFYGFFCKESLCWQSTELIWLT
jgi:hypothetical protein